MALKQVNVRINEQLLKEVKIKCLHFDMTFQEAVDEALKKWLEDKEKTARI